MLGYREHPNRSPWVAQLAPEGPPEALVSDCSAKVGYNDSGIRVVGAHPRHPRLLYNLGCNGVGFLPSIHGGRRVAQVLAGDRMPASVFDRR